MSSKVFDSKTTGSLPAWMPASDPSVKGDHHETHEGGATGGTSGEDNSELDDLAAKLSQLQQEAAALRARIPEEKRSAFHEGVAQAEAAAVSKWNESLQRSARAISELAQYRPKLRREVESDAVRLALAIARKILHRELAVDPSAIAGLVRVAFDKVNARDVLRVRLAAQDHAIVRDMVSSLGVPERIEFVADTALERGSVVLDTNQGQLDASVLTQFEEIERGLADALQRSSA